MLKDNIEDTSVAVFSQDSLYFKLAFVPGYCNFSLTGQDAQELETSALI